MRKERPKGNPSQVTLEPAYLDIADRIVAHVFSTSGAKITRSEGMRIALRAWVAQHKPSGAEGGGA